MRLLREPTDPGAERGPAWAACFRYDLSAGDQFVQLCPGLSSIGLLRTVLAGRDDQHAFSRRALAGQRTEALPYVLGKRRRLADIEAQLDGGGDFVDVLAARAGGANEADCKFGIWNEYGQMLFPA